MVRRHGKPQRGEKHFGGGLPQGHIVCHLQSDTDHGRQTEPDPASPLWHQAEGTIYNYPRPELLPGIGAMCLPHRAFQGHFLFCCSWLPQMCRLPTPSSARQSHFHLQMAQRKHLPRIRRDKLSSVVHVQARGRRGQQQRLNHNSSR